MCNFFSCISDGKGHVKFFKPEDIATILSEGNPKSYDFNSHTSLMNWLGIKGKDEEKWAKWEYSPEFKQLKLDNNGVGDDEKKIKAALENYFVKKDVQFLRNLYGRNSGDGNSGNGNSGDANSGDGNSGDANSGDGNSGNRNSGNGNSGHRNSGHRNSGNGNSGDGNSGDGNSGDGVLNAFCTKRAFLLFDMLCTKEEYEKIYKFDWSWFWINKWINESEMTPDEKEQHPTFKMIGGYLKKIEYKEAFKACPQEFIEEVKKLKNYDAAKFESITGLKV